MRVEFRTALFLQLLLLTQIASCAKDSYVSLDDSLSQDSGMFSDCNSLEGSANLSLFQGSDFLFDIEADWVSENSGNWRLELSDRFGRSSGFVTYFVVENVLATSGAFPKQLPKIETDKSGFLQIGGRFIGLKARDLPCHLAGLVPNRWRSKVVNQRFGPTLRSLDISDYPTDVSLSFFTSPNSPNRYCFDSVWAGIWIFFRQTIEVCRTHGELPLTEIKVGSSKLRVAELK